MLSAIDWNAVRHQSEQLSVIIGIRSLSSASSSSAIRRDVKS
jgi:hypothetical protein